MGVNPDMSSSGPIGLTRNYVWKSSSFDCLIESPRRFSVNTSFAHSGDQSAPLVKKASQGQDAPTINKHGEDQSAGPTDKASENPSAPPRKKVEKLSSNANGGVNPVRSEGQVKAAAWRDQVVPVIDIDGSGFASSIGLSEHAGNLPPRGDKISNSNDRAKEKKWNPAKPLAENRPNSSQANNLAKENKWGPLISLTEHKQNPSQANKLAKENKWGPLIPVAEHRLNSSQTVVTAPNNSRPTYDFFASLNERDTSPHKTSSDDPHSTNNILHYPVESKLPKSTNVTSSHQMTPKSLHSNPMASDNQTDAQSETAALHELNLRSIQEFTRRAEARRRREAEIIKGIMELEVDEEPLPEVSNKLTKI